MGSPWRSVSTRIGSVTSSSRAWGGGGVSGLRLGNPPRYVMDRVDVDGGQVLAIRIIENEIGFKPCYILAKGVEAGSYKRVDDKDLRLTHMEIYEYRNALIPSRADSTPVPESGVDDLDGELTDALIGRKLTSKALTGVTDRATRLERLNVLASDGRVRLAGLLALGQYPQQFEPKLLIDVACHPGTGKSMPGMPRFLDRVLCDGPLPTAIEDAVHATVRNLRTISVVNGVGRRDECELPVEALREAIANAVVHREYHPYFTGQSVSVDVFSDRVVVRNPGGLWGGKTLENIADGTSRCRNAILMQLMESVPAPVAGPTVEGQGSGVELMVRLMRERGLPEPEFRVSADQFAVVFHRPEKADWRLTSRVGQDDLAGDDPIVSASFVGIGGKPGAGREVAFLSIMTRQGPAAHANWPNRPAYLWKPRDVRSGLWSSRARLFPPTPRTVATEDTGCRDRKPCGRGSRDCGMSALRSADPPSGLHLRIKRSISCSTRAIHDGTFRSPT